MPPVIVWAIIFLCLIARVHSTLGEDYDRTRYGQAGTLNSPPAPDYARRSSWAAWPGKSSGADAVPAGLPAAAETSARADVFFVHPTTYLSLTGGNAHYDERGRTKMWIESGVLRFQASVFNGCCRIFAPRYRQASLGSLLRQNAEDEAAIDLAYSDILRAFDYYIEHENKGRPFIIASHSQGSLHAMRLLQERVIGTPLRKTLVAAYLVGSGLPVEIERLGLPICKSARQTGCVINWNSVAGGSWGIDRGRALIWLDGGYRQADGSDIVCVNPLTWTANGEAPAEANLGGLPAAKPDEPMPPPVKGLTGATCSNGMLSVSIPLGYRRGFTDILSLFGSYHVFDYNLFYVNIRENAIGRVSAFLAERI